MSASGFVEFTFTLFVLWFVWRFVSSLLRRPTRPAEPEADDYAGVPARLRPRPKAGAGAIALEEPDNDE
ncbi:hypothetical protein BH10ACI4_BH10ACI4_05720 [soil metagenome]